MPNEIWSLRRVVALTTGQKFGVLALKRDTQFILFTGSKHFVLKRSQITSQYLKTISYSIHSTEPFQIFQEKCPTQSANGFFVPLTPLLS